MKNKIIIVFYLLLSLLLLTSCTDIKYVTQEQSKINLQDYMNKIEELMKAKNYTYTIKENKDESEDDEDNNDEDNNETETIFTKRYDISINNSFTISVEVFSYDSIKGVENFVIHFKNKLNNISEKNNIDLNLFVDIINSISGKQITYEYCKDFLDALESEYAPGRYGLSKQKDQLIYKTDFLNFEGDWIIEYKLSKDLKEDLSLSGITKNSIK